MTQLLSTMINPILARGLAGIFQHGNEVEVWGLDVNIMSIGGITNVLDMLMTL
jgi:hypothetical protein